MLKILEQIVLEIIWVFNEAAIYILFGFFIVMATRWRPTLQECLVRYVSCLQEGLFRSAGIAG